MMDDGIVVKPTPIGGAITLLGGLLAIAVTVGFSAPAAAAGLAGLVVLLGGLMLPRPGLLTAGAGLLALAVFLAGGAGAPATAVGIGFVGTVVAWDVSHNSLSHGRQVGSEAPTAPPEAMHASASFGVGVVAVMVGYGIFTAAGTGRPATAVGLLAVGAVLLILAIK